MDQLTEIKELLRRYKNRECMSEEVVRLHRYIQSGKDKDFIQQLISAGLLEEVPQRFEKSPLLQAKLNSLFERIQLNKKQEAKLIPLKGWKLAGIAASLILISALTLFLYKTTNNDRTINTVQTLTDVLPGGDRATLTLADGSVINLSDAGKGEIAAQIGVRIYKDEEGQLTYESSGFTGQNHVPQQNIISTPYGGQYRLRLPDGSEVFLNAGTTLKYPASFSAKQRSVELEGEAYFNIAHDKNKPFVVKALGQEVEVLGTRFSVNCYADEKRITTTLEQGSVKVQANHLSKIIKPGEQSIWYKGQLSVKNADMEIALAWKNGEINFKNADVESIMRQVERWYDVKVEYKGEIPDRTFTGAISRKSSLSALLKVLELNEVHFDLVEEGKIKKLIVQQ